MSTLDSFALSSRRPPETAATSQEIRDRGSLFVANIFPASTVQEAQKAINHLKHVIHGSKPASHEVAAWRCMVLKNGKTGLGGPDDFELISGSDDDGEKYAGGRVLQVMQAEGVIDAVVVVSRWFGGEMIGPARFSHFETCAREVCRTFRLKDDMESYIATLTSLDDILASLRAELADLRAKKASDEVDNAPEAQTSSITVMKKVPNYKDMQAALDVNKAKRLITARENSIKSVKTILKKEKDGTR